MMGYAEAIEEQAQKCRYYASQHGWEEILIWLAQTMPHLANAPAKDRPKVIETVKGMATRLVVQLSRATAFSVNRDVGTLIAAAAESLPWDTPLHRELLPEFAGYVRFEDALPLPLRKDGAYRPLRAVSWSTFTKDREGGRWATWDNNATDTSLDVTFWVDSEEDDRGNSILCFWEVDLGDAAPQSGPTLDEHPERAQRISLATRYLLAFFLFVRQSILAVSRRPVTNRQARRRLERELKHEPVVHVVELRKREYQQRDESHDTPVEWSCQWLVRGHWHRYHTANGLEPRWVAPYVKGPTDKPLKAPATIAYEVVR